MLDQIAWGIALHLEHKAPHKVSDLFSLYASTQKPSPIPYAAGSDKFDTI